MAGLKVLLVFGSLAFMDNIDTQVFICIAVHTKLYYNPNDRLVTLAFAGSIGMTLIILACALPQYQLWWPFFVVIFYILSVIPTFVAIRTQHSMVDSSSSLDLSVFCTVGFVISSFALPIVLARTSVIMLGACYLTICGNIVVYLTIIGYFLFFENDEDNVYGGMA